MTMIYYRSERFDFNVSLSEGHIEFRSKQSTFEIQHRRENGVVPQIVVGQAFEAIVTGSELVVVTGAGHWRRAADWCILSVFEIEAGLLVIEELKVVTLKLDGELIAEAMLSNVCAAHSISDTRLHYTDIDEGRKIVFDLPTLNVLED
jgi:hypothetical protein